MGTIWSASPCKIKVGTSTFLRSSVKSVSEKALMQSYAPIIDTCIPCSQNVSVKGDGKVLEELRAVRSHASTNLVERRQLKAVRICLGFQHKWWDRADQHGLRYSFGSVPADVAHDFAAPRGMADQSYVLKIQLVEQRSQIIGVCVHVVAVPGLARTSMSTTVVGNDAIAVLSQKEHLWIP